MFSVLTILAIVVNLLPLNAVYFNGHANINSASALPQWQIKNFPTPTGIEESQQIISELEDTRHAPGYAIDPKPEQGNDMNQPVAHNVIVKESPTPSPSPAVTQPEPTTRPMPVIIQPQTPLKDHSESGCPPCGGGNGKFECVQVACPL